MIHVPWSTNTGSAVVFAMLALTIACQGAGIIIARPDQGAAATLRCPIPNHDSRIKILESLIISKNEYVLHENLTF